MIEIEPAAPNDLNLINQQENLFFDKGFYATELCGGPPGSNCQVINLSLEDTVGILRAWHMTRHKDGFM